MKRAIWWARRDLRLTDNQALTEALNSRAEVLPVFILDPRLLQSRYAATRRLDFLKSGLHALDRALHDRGSRLIVQEGSPAELLGRLCREFDVDLIVAQRDGTPFASQRDQQVRRMLPDVELRLTEGLTIRPIGSVRKRDGLPYTVFTPYARQWRAGAMLRPDDLLSAPERIVTPSGARSIELAEGGALLAGELAAGERLLAFTSGASAPIYRYGQERDRPDLDGTSQLSPFLRFGMLSPRTAAVQAMAAMERAPDDAKRQSAAVWLNELIWREFYVNILHDFPRVRRGSFREDYDRIEWQNDPSDFNAWCQGKTGYPFVDAAMRQLLATGWMHNRARMVVASFLVKDLLIDWRWGEQWFMQHLLDGDPAANNGGWQWSAGVGTDAAPYFRIFNPVTQGKKFDPEGAYVRRWVPELARVPGALVHEPWRMTASMESTAGCTIGLDYPVRLVDHSQARLRTLAVYKAALAR